MGLEVATYLADLNAAWPLGTDQKSTADDHLRLIKTVLQTSFPNYSSATTASASGSFTGTLTGFTANPTGTFRWIKSGGIATLYTAANITGTSNAVTMTLTGIPAAITPAASAGLLGIPVGDVIDVGNAQCGFISINSSGVFTFGRLVVSGTTVQVQYGSFTASGTKGVGLLCVTYPLS